MTLSPRLHFDFGAQRQINVHARAELDQADAFAALNGVILGNPRHDAARNQSGNQAHADFFAARLDGIDADQDIFIELGRSRCAWR